ncbi:hypothetical protein STAN_4064 [Streptomyces sp. CBMAI 2042]|nr:hypothetical protein STAN_4064 [Streptomyces sp. CBMAI 2042]
MPAAQADEGRSWTLEPGFTTVKTVKTSSTGTLKTTVKASADGTWRYSFAGTPSTPAVSATGDYLDVK